MSLFVPEDLKLQWALIARRYNNEVDGKALVVWMNSKCGTMFSFKQVTSLAGIVRFVSETNNLTIITS